MHLFVHYQMTFTAPINHAAGYWFLLLLLCN